MSTVWQRLGAFVYSIDNCDLNRLRHFHSIGGRWVVPVLIGDKATGPDNRAQLAQFKANCAAAGVRCGLWANGFGEPAAELAAEVAALAKGQNLSPVILDLEAPYKRENAPKMPELLAAVRKLMPTRLLGVSSYGFCDREMIWNGRTLDPPRSFYDMRVRFLPQWYYVYDAKYEPDWCMEDLRDNGATDGNIADASAPGGRGVPLPYVHGTLEVTGVEDSSLAVGLAMLRDARVYGFTYGFSIYTLESMPDADFELLAAERGKLFLT